MTEAVQIGIPDKFYVSHNYPNPINPSTIINYNLPYSSNLRISLYDMNGKLVKLLSDDFKSSGYHEIKIEAADLSTGIYYCNFEFDNGILSGKIIVLK